MGPKIGDLALVLRLDDGGDKADLRGVDGDRVGVRSTGFDGEMGEISTAVRVGEARTLIFVTGVDGLETMNRELRLRVCG